MVHPQDHHIAASQLQCYVHRGLHHSGFPRARVNCKNLLMPFSYWAIFQGIFKRENGPLRHSRKQPIKVGKLPIKEGKRPISANGQFSGAPPWWKTAPLKRPILRSMIHCIQEVLNATPLNPTPATCHKRKQKLRCNFQKVALQKLPCNIRFSAMRKLFLHAYRKCDFSQCTSHSKYRCSRTAVRP